MNANSDLDALAATQTEEITDEVLQEANFDAIVNRMDIKFLPRKTALGFYKLQSTSSSADAKMIPELWCVGYITNKLSTESGPKFAVLHEDTRGGTAISVFRSEESKAFGFNETGLYQHRTRLRNAFGDIYDSLIRFEGAVGGLGELDEMEIVPPVSKETATISSEVTTRSVRDVRDDKKKSDESRGLRTSFFNNRQALQTLVPNIYDLTYDRRLFQTISRKLQHTANNLEGLKSAESTLNVLSFNFMPTNQRAKYEKKDLLHHFTFRDLLFPDQLKRSMENYDTLRDVVHNFRVLMTELMVEPADRQRWSNILTPMYDAFNSENPTTTIRTAAAEDVYTYLQETFTNMVIFLTAEETESLSADVIETRLSDIWRLDTQKLLVYSTQAKNLRDARKRELETSESLSASSGQEASEKAGAKKPTPPKKSKKPGAAESRATSAEAQEAGTKALCLSDTAFVIREGVGATACNFGPKCRYKHFKLPYLQKHKKEVLQLFEAVKESQFKTETIALVNKWP